MAFFDRRHRSGRAVLDIELLQNVFDVLTDGTSPCPDNDAYVLVALIAEEVGEVIPDLIIRDKGGKPESVRYEAVNAMLLNEFIKEHRKVLQLETTVAQQQKGMEVLATQLKEQAAQIQKVSAQVEMGKPAPRTVVDNR